MAQSEDVLWNILGLLYGNKAGWSSEISGKKNITEIENAHVISTLKGKLVLKFLPEDIEDTIYFMKHRNYLSIHGQARLEFVYSLSEKAIDVYKCKQLPDEEAVSFKEALWNFEPKMYGVGPNMKGWKKLWKKHLTKA